MYVIAFYPELNLNALCLNPRTHPSMILVIQTVRTTSLWWSLRTTWVWPFSPCSAASGPWASLPSIFHRRYTNTHKHTNTQTHSQSWADKIQLGSIVHSWGWVFTLCSMCGRSVQFFSVVQVKDLWRRAVTRRLHLQNHTSEIVQSWEL